MSFEERIKGEKQSIGYSVSGHGLDGLKPFIDKRSIGREFALQFLKDFETSEQNRAFAMEETPIPSEE
jgi:hypothetical protein